MSETTKWSAAGTIYLCVLAAWVCVWLGCLIIGIKPTWLDSWLNAMMIAAIALTFVNLFASMCRSLTKYR